MPTPTDARTVAGDALAESSESIGKLSAFQLYRLRHDIDLLLSDPDRIRAVRQQVREGDVVEYFDPEKNRCVAAEVEACHRTRVSVRNLDDGVAWRIEYVAINVDGEQRPESNRSANQITRAQLAVGDVVGFTDRQNRDRIGEVVKLNPKTAGLLVEDGTRWRVPYSLLFSIVDTEGRVKTEIQQRLTVDDFSHG